jgi:hypothetical protein
MGVQWHYWMRTRLRCWAGMTWIGQLDEREVDGDEVLVTSNKVDDIGGTA